MSQRTRYALVGAGSRAEMYVDALAASHADVAELAAILDTNSGRAEHYRSRTATLSGQSDLPVTAAPDALERIIAEQHIDRVIVTSPDVTHAEYIVRAVRAGVDVIVEKPLTIDEQGAAAIAHAVAATGRSVVTTFNYRYSPRNAALKDAVASGQIGSPTSVHFEWLLDTGHGADYFRRWHRDKANSGGLLVHKASHHFDLVNWWIDDVPRRVFASGGLRFYGADNAARRGLGPRPARGTGAASGDPFALDLSEDARLSALYLDNERFDGYQRDRDVFSDGITIEDNLSLVVDYSRGASMSYSLNAHSPWEGYRIAVNGTAGRLELDVVERGMVAVSPTGGGVIDPSATADGDAANATRPASERLVLQRHWEPASELPIANGEGAHGGGDARMLDDLLRGTSVDPLRRAATWRDGIAAISVGIAGNQSLESGGPVLIDDLELGIAVAETRTVAS
ncbi:Gfo/Idh/MocA family protein [Microbacterium sp. MPKO10]|uniref:Gfo/Idh/MocA family protein n=1 Tax=Microbacterium sp. MPKO10 TaxID=2989818 RepID=UPI002235D913|nr:Gfo/Idh/MocA family oxidoreductase [Microbacterium sp. MPKO10]MCW4456975.1 Gfo/Idh/MocA family oxidoreductase [Microbacterium sp. MPKO10]